MNPILEAVLPHQAAIIAEYLAGNRMAGQLLLRAHEGFIRNTVQRLMRRGRELDPDCLQEARLGFLHCLASYDDTRGGLLNFAAYHIRARVNRWRVATEELVCLPQNQRRRAFAAMRAGKTQSQLLAEGDKRTAAALTWISLRGTKRDMSGAIGLTELHADTDDELEMHDWRQACDELVGFALRVLNKRERLIIYRRFLGETEETLAEIGVSLNLSRERIRQLEAGALMKMRDALYVRKMHRIGFGLWVATALHELKIREKKAA